MKFLNIFILLLFLSCDNKEINKDEAFHYYKQIFEAFGTNKEDQRQLNDDLALYLEFNLIKDEISIDRIALNEMFNKNEELIRSLNYSKQTIQNILEIDENRELKTNALKTIEEIISLQEDCVAPILKSVEDGKLSEDEGLHFKNHRDQLLKIKSQYKNWKKIRKTYCEKYEITFDDLNGLINQAK